MFRITLQMLYILSEKSNYNKVKNPVQFKKLY